MKFKDITEALNHYYLAKFPNAKGWFIGIESSEPTKLNAYKEFKYELFYHTPGKNHKVLHQQIVDRCVEGSEDVVKNKMMISWLESIFSNLSEFDKYETI